MIRQRGIGLLIELLLFAALAAGALLVINKAVGAFKDWIGEPYAAAQRAIDEPIIAKANTDRDEAKRQTENARADTATCVAGSKTQSEKVEYFRGAMEAQRQAALKAKAAGAAESQRKQDAQRKYADASSSLNIAVVGKQTCEERFGNIDKMVRDAERAERAARGAKGSAVPK